MLQCAESFLVLRVWEKVPGSALRGERGFVRAAGALFHRSLLLRL